ncbi:MULTISPECIES: peptidoglycan editing factor PgeF [Rhodomicrobium]|uniref:peptidoglycan editing factor PgeF n=1 Tax=Rhodomicrobium TaxID=1068 RepID=UPI000B4B1D95|nr:MULTISPECIES: peptidoglycan editing factor PgeF [Rhodomicrobium]
MIVSDLLKEQTGIRHGFFTRQGGVSEGIYASLNCGLGSSDDPCKVIGNRALVAAKLGTVPDRLITVYQVHGRDAIVADAPWSPANAPKADAIVTATPGLAIGVLSADCTPLLFADAEARVVGAAHAGWRGAKAGVIDSAIGAMEGLGAKRERICVAIGPAISQAAYEVGPEFQAAFTDDNADNSRYFAPRGESGRRHFDLTGFCYDRALAAGVASVENLGLCTYADDSLFYSYRRSVHRKEPDYGRQISAIVIM